MEIKADDLSGFYMLPKRWRNVKERIRRRDELTQQLILCRGAAIGNNAAKVPGGKSTRTGNIAGETQENPARKL